jgi:tetratricopeptide (TPR) repeat protein
MDLYRRDAIWSPLARLLAAEARRVADPERKLALVREASQLLRWQLDDLPGAAALLEWAVAGAPEDGSLRLSLADVLEALQRWDQVVPVLNAQIAWHRDARSKDRALCHHRLAGALVRCGRPEEALAQLRLATEMHPSHPAILCDLGRVALDVGQLDLSESTYRVLLLALQHPAHDLGVPSPRRAEVLLDLSEVATRKGDVVRAGDLVDSAFELALEDREDPGYFERALAARGRPDLLARAVERRVERAPTLAARAVALGDLVGIWTERLDRAEGLRARILQHAERVGRDLESDDRADAGSWTALSSVYASVGDLERTATLLQVAIDRTGAGPERAGLRVSLARLLLEDGTRRDDAIAALSAAHDEAPTRFGAAELLSEVLERDGRFHDLVALLERRLQALAAANDTAACLDTAWRLGRALERVGRERDALPVYESMLGWEPRDGEVVRALANRLEELGSKRLADGVERLIELDASAAPALAKRLLDLRDAQGDVPGTARALRIGFSVDPGNPAFRDRLLMVHRTSGAHAELLEVLDGAIAARPGDGELLSLRAGLRDAAGDCDGALSDLEEASVADPRHIDALVGLLGQVVNRPPEDQSAGSGALDAHAMRLIELLMRKQRPDDARRELGRLLSRKPDHPGGLLAAASLAVAGGKWDEAIEVYRKLLPVVAGGDRADLLHVVEAMADACERGGRIADARDALEGALVLVPHDAALMQRLERIYESLGDWARLAGLLVGRAELQPDAAEKSRLLLLAGRLLLEHARDPSAALDVIERARAASPESIEAALLWARATMMLGRPHEALAVLHDAAGRTRGKRSALLVFVNLEIGKAHLSLDELLEGFDALKAGFALNGRVCEMAMLLGLVAIDLGEMQVAERALAAVTTMPSRSDAAADGADPASRAIAFYHLASIAYDKGDIGRARRLATKAVTGDPDHVAARALLARLEVRAAGARAPT